MSGWRTFWITRKWRRWALRWNGCCSNRNSCGVRARTRRCGCFTSFTRRRLWVANGCVLWLNMRRYICGQGLPDRQTESRRRFMADKVKVWFDAEADYLEVRFSDAAGYEKETKHDAVMERVDKDGHVIGFSILGVSRFKKDKPLEAELAAT